MSRDEAFHSAIYASEEEVIEDPTGKPPTSRAEAERKKEERMLVQTP